LEDEYRRYGARYVDYQKGVDMELREYELADAIFVPSTFVLDSFIKHGFPPEKLFRIPFGCPTAGVRPRRQQGRTFRVVYVGALAVHKGVRYLLEAAALLRGLPGFEVVLVGPPPRPPVTEYLEAYAGTVRHLGYVPKPRLYAEVYPTASVLVQPSVLEGLSFVLLEALAHGVPVIATENSGARDVVSDGEDGYVIPIRDPAAIAERLLFLYRNPDALEAMSRRALQKAKAEATWEEYGRRVVSIYGHLLGNTHGRAG